MRLTKFTILLLNDQLPTDLESVLELDVEEVSDCPAILTVHNRIFQQKTWPIIRVGSSVDWFQCFALGDVFDLFGGIASLVRGDSREAPTTCHYQPVRNDNIMKMTLCCKSMEVGKESARWQCGSD